MFVPRAFSLGQSKPRPSDISTSDEKRPLRQHNAPQRDSVRGFGWRPASFHPQAPTVSGSRTLPHRDAAQSSTPTQPADTVDRSPSPQSLVDHHSKPVAVPSKRQSATAPTSNSLPSRGRQQDARQPARDTSRNARHIPSSVANVLASTSIPRRTTFPKRQPNPTSSKRMSIAELVEEWKQSDATASPSSFGSSPAMDLLLSSPDDDDIDGEPLIDDDDDESIGSPKRTVSSHSVPSLDDSSSQSGLSFSIPSTPAAAAGSSPRGRERLVSSPQSIDAGADHPLHYDKSPHADDARAAFPPDPVPIVLPPPTLASQGSTKGGKQTKRSFRSNLTASLKSLASRTFSNFAAPSTSTEPTSLLIAPYQPEMRPRPLSSPPTSAHRRYMNPHAFQPYAFHLHNHSLQDADFEIVAAGNAAAAIARAAGDPDAPALSPDALDAIPMEIVRKSRAAGKQNGSGTEAGRTRISLGAKREPRENPEFLRIAVLELQMRRAGKTEGPPTGFGAGAGRRGWWLSPRQVSEDDLCREWRRKDDIPARWVGVGVNDPVW